MSLRIGFSEYIGTEPFQIWTIRLVYTGNNINVLRLVTRRLNVSYLKTETLYTLTGKEKESSGSKEVTMQVPRGLHLIGNSGLFTPKTIGNHFSNTHILHITHHAYHINRLGACAAVQLRLRA
jgi:hypothetical protein